MNTFVCAGCGTIQPLESSESEMMEEYIKDVGLVIATMDERVIVCDDCYEIYKEHMKNNPQLLNEIKENLLHERSN